ncbi:type VI secretion protein VgrG, partial [Photobacterium angustum]
HVKADQTLVVDGNLHMKQGQALLVDAGNEVHLKAGSKAVIEAGAEITLKAGGSFIKIDASGVSISGAAVNINAGGSAGSGSGFGGLSPLLPGAVEAAPQLEQVPLLFSEALLMASQANVPLLPLCGLQTDGQCQRGEQCLCKK